jgi:hypothetical protein
MTVLWDVAPCSLVETSVNFYETTRRNIPKDSDPHTRPSENLKFHFVSSLYSGLKVTGCHCTDTFVTTFYLDIKVK